MMLTTTKVEDFDGFLKIFSTKGAEKRKQHGNFLSDSEGPAIIKEAGHVGKPQPATFGGQYGS